MCVLFSMVPYLEKAEGTVRYHNVGVAVEASTLHRCAVLCACQVVAVGGGNTLGCGFEPWPIQAAKLLGGAYDLVPTASLARL